MEAIHPLHTAATRVSDEASYFADSLPPLTDAELAQYERHTTKRPLICSAALVALPFIAEGVCRALGAW